MAIGIRVSYHGISWEHERQTTVTRSAASSKLNTNPSQFRRQVEIGPAGMATEVYPVHHVSITRPGIRPETRADVIAILANTANGCLQELGYSPGLLERLRYLEDVRPASGLMRRAFPNAAPIQHVAKGKETNEKLLHNKKTLLAIVEDVRNTCQTYQKENVELYEDNTRLLGEGEKLRAEVALLQAQLRVHQETRGMSSSDIITQYATLQIEYRDAVKQLSRRIQTNSNPSNAGAGVQSQQGLVRARTSEFYFC
ncbi:hypothetical protein C8F04DRAFT_592284 [Mycena alexandri]|uniref:Uncharacterized protein n=1 Tax=Mycena alexandri TaxID=1745969 RepID=A0AAD6TFB8_9AGAR|nr:hypothetical protein C8F04DRAFT_592284 [Mycena alexandri]